MFELGTIIGDQAFPTVVHRFEIRRQPGRRHAIAHQQFIEADDRQAGIDRPGQPFLIFGVLHICAKSADPLEAFAIDDEVRTRAYGVFAQDLGKRQPARWYRGVRTCVAQARFVVLQEGDLRIAATHLWPIEMKLPMRGQLVSMPDVVGVEECNKQPACKAHPEVARCRNAGVTLRTHMDTPVVCGQGAHDGKTAVGGPIVEKQELEIRFTLFEHAFDRGNQRVFGVMNRDDDRETWRVHA